MLYGEQKACQYQVLPLMRMNFYYALPRLAAPPPIPMLCRRLKLVPLIILRPPIVLYSHLVVLLQLRMA